MSVCIFKQLFYHLHYFILFCFQLCLFSCNLSQVFLQLIKTFLFARFSPFPSSLLLKADKSRYENEKERMMKYEKNI